MSSSLRVEEAPLESRAKLLPIVDAGFHGLYRRHARRTLGSVRWVTTAIRAGVPVGLAMYTLTERDSGYVYYIVVVPPERGRGVGGVLLDDTLQRLHAEGARYVFASIRVDNVPSIRLFQSRGFVRTSVGKVARSRGLVRAVRLWSRMVVVPGERVLMKAFDHEGGLSHRL